MKSVFLLSFVMNVLTINGFDPDLELCIDPSVDAAVIADDNISYVFKDDFYWELNPTSGIPTQTVANYISSRWNGLNGPIDAAFAIDDQNHKLSTVFIKVGKHIVNRFVTKTSLNTNQRVINGFYTTIETRRRTA